MQLDNELFWYYFSIIFAIRLSCDFFKNVLVFAFFDVLIPKSNYLRTEIHSYFSLFIFFFLKVGGLFSWNRPTACLSVCSCAIRHENLACPGNSGSLGISLGRLATEAELQRRQVLSKARVWKISVHNFSF